jgi:hypothetical protein
MLFLDKNKDYYTILDKVESLVMWNLGRKFRTPETLCITYIDKSII